MIREALGLTVLALSALGALWALHRGTKDHRPPLGDPEQDWAAMVATLPTPTEEQA